MDLALSATYFPELGLSFAILYGCSLSIERNVMQRLHEINIEATHPLLIPGIFAELELMRHIRLVDSNINQVEAKIFELDFRCGDSTMHEQLDMELRNTAKRSAWLDLTYLRNSLVSWNAQLLKMVEHAELLNERVFKLSHGASSRLLYHDDHAESSGTWTSTTCVSTEEDLAIPLKEKQTIELNGHDDFAYLSQHKEHSINQPGMEGLELEEKVLTIGDRSKYVYRTEEDHNLQGPSCTEQTKRIVSKDTISVLQDNEDYLKYMLHVGDKIRGRITAIRDEYEDKIRDCTMRVDGMAMATQWVFSFPTIFSLGHY